MTMNPMPPQLSGTTLWLLAFAALAAVIGWETDWGSGIKREPPKSPLPAPQPVQVALLPEYGVDGGLAARRETVERPPFVPTRRPAPAPAQEAAKPRMQKGQFTLTGTAVVDQKAIAFLRETQNGKARSVRAGETINGLTVVEVAKDRVRLALGDESEELVLRIAGGPRMTIQPPQPGAPGPAAVAGAVPAAPGAPPAPGTSAGAAVAGQPAAVDSDQSILERRRAARAAQAAAEAARAAGQAPAVQPPTQAPAAAPVQGRQGFAEMYRQRAQPTR
jgi:hypothetical protein